MGDQDVVGHMSTTFFTWAVSRAALHVQIGSRNMTRVAPSNSTEMGYGVSVLQPAQFTETIDHPLALLPRSSSRTPTFAVHRAGLHQIGRRLALPAVRALRNDTNMAVNSGLLGTAPNKPPRRRAILRISAMLSALAISLLACSTPLPNPSKRHESTPSAGRSYATSAQVPYATTAQVLEAVKSAEQLRTLPETVAASLQKSDDGRGASGCFDRLDMHKPAILETHELASDIIFGECASGDPDGTKLMVIFGDSRAWMFGAPLELIAAKTGWKLRVFSFGGCEVDDLEFLSDQTNAPNEECDAFRSSAIFEIRALHPNLVITTSAGDHRLADGTAPTPAQLQGAWVSTFQKLALPGTRLAMIGPIPFWPNDDARCLAAHVGKVQACSIATAKVVTNEYEAPQAAAAAMAGVLFVSPRPWVCADKCEPVIADIGVYRERYHFSSAYAVYLTGALNEALQPAMA